MKKRFADGSSLKNVKKEFFNKAIEDQEFKGNVCLLKINKVIEPWYVTDDGETDCILDNNYKWLEIYPKNEKYAITVMYNDKNQLIEWYFDIVKNIGVEDGIPYIDDLYLDLVIKPDGRIIILDEDELEGALKIGDITKQDFNLAYDTMEKLKKKYTNSLEELYNYTNKFYKMFNKEFN